MLNDPSAAGTPPPCPHSAQPAAAPRRAACRRLPTSRARSLLPGKGRHAHLPSAGVEKPCEYCGSGPYKTVVDSDQTSNYSGYDLHVHYRCKDTEKNPYTGPRLAKAAHKKAAEKAAPKKKTAKKSPAKKR